MVLAHHMSENPTYQDLARKRESAATRGWASSRFTSAIVAALTCTRVILFDRNCFVFTITHVYTGLMEAAMVPSSNPTLIGSYPTIRGAGERSTDSVVCSGD